METVDPLWRPLTGASRKKKKIYVYMNVYILVITLPFPERDNKAPLPVSWDDACVPGRAQNCMKRHEYNTSTSLEKFSMDATDPRSFTPISIGSLPSVFLQKNVDSSCLEGQQ